MAYLDDYEKAEDCELRERANYWKIAFGLQAVDGLKPSNFLIELAKKHIEGETTMDEVKAALENYYTAKNATVNLENATVKLSKTQSAILELLQTNPKLTMLEISQDLGRDITTIKRAIKSLKEKGLLERIGSDKTGYWKVKA